MGSIDTDAMTDRATAAIDDRREDIIELAESVRDEPELGFKETKTTRKVATAFEDLGIEVETDLAITGVRSRIGSGELVVAVIGELDALVNPEHPRADPDTGAVHACGHHAQLANLYGTAIAFAETDIIDTFDGSIELIAVPAEEYLDLGYRKTLVDSGDLEFLGGKQELIRRGYLDDVDAALMVHAGSETPERTITADISSNGFVGKFVTYEGRESHAGAAPDEGINALNAAMLGMNAIHTARERFRDEDHVRVHPILTHGGDGVNVVPSEATMESYTRAKTVEAIEAANDDVNRALESGAMAVGARVEINDYPGYLPMRSDPTLVAAFEAHATDRLGDDGVSKETVHMTGSTDMGDITQLVPGIQPFIGGFDGAVHSREFHTVDEEMGYVIPSKLTVGTIIDVLADADRREALMAAKAEKTDVETYLKTVRTMRADVVGDYLTPES
ncbi:MAG: amidohydrolase [Halobacteriales archaeon]